MDLGNLIKGRGLKYHDSEAREVTEDKRKVTKYIPRERPLQESDIMSHRVYGDIVIIVTKDGRRYNIPPKAGRDTTKKETTKKKPGKDELHPREKTLLEKGMTATAKGYSYKSLFIHKDKLLAMNDEEFQGLIDSLAEAQKDDK